MKLCVSVALMQIETQILINVFPFDAESMLLPIVGKICVVTCSFGLQYHLLCCHRNILSVLKYYLL